MIVDKLACELVIHPYLKQRDFLADHPGLPPGRGRLLLQSRDLVTSRGGPRVEEGRPRPLLGQLQLALLEVGAEAAKFGDSSLLGEDLNLFEL